MSNDMSSNDLISYVPAPENGEVLEITRKNAYKEPLPPYNIVGNGFTNRNGTSVDVLEVCLQLNLSEMKLLQFFRTAFTTKMINRVEEPNVIVPKYTANFDQYLQTALMKNYKHLEHLQVMRRMKRGVYILNPRMFIPSRGYTAMVVAWDRIKQVKDDE